MPAVIAFPSPFERDQLEFERSGSSNYLRAIDGASALWAAVSQGRDRLSLATRINALAAQIEHLARYRPDCLGDMVTLTGGCLVELRLVPAALRSMLGRAAND